MVVKSDVQWVSTAEREPPDGVLVWWEEGGRCVTGYRMGRVGGGLWVIPYRRGVGPLYCRRPDRWAPA